MRYEVRSGSQSGHCCFVATVVDTKKPDMFDGQQYLDHGEEICECFEMADAKRIAAALNLAEAQEQNDG